MFAMSCDNQVHHKKPVVTHCAIRQYGLCISFTGSFFSSTIFVIIIQIAYAATAATAYPIMLLTSIFSNTNVLANALSTRKLVLTGTPILVNINSSAGAIA